MEKDKVTKFIIIGIVGVVGFFCGAGSVLLYNHCTSDDKPEGAVATATTTEGAAQTEAGANAGAGVQAQAEVKNP